VMFRIGLEFGGLGIEVSGEGFHAQSLAQKLTAETRRI
jgi:hypothetical protein